MEPVLPVTSKTDFTALPWPTHPFCALVLAPRPVAGTVKSALSHALVEAGCISMGAWGPDSTTWDDEGDYACILHRDGRPRDALNDMMTWWLDKDPLSEALDFARQDAALNDDAPLVILTFDQHLPAAKLGFDETRSAK